MIDSLTCSATFSDVKITSTTSWLPEREQRWRGVSLFWTCRQRDKQWFSTDNREFPRNIMPAMLVSVSKEKSGWFSNMTWTSDSDWMARGIVCSNSTIFAYLLCANRRPVRFPLSCWISQSCRWRGACKLRRDIIEMGIHLIECNPGDISWKGWIPIEHNLRLHNPSHLHCTSLRWDLLHFLTTAARWSRYPWDWILCPGE